MSSYHDRIEAETATGHPAWPCPHCGHDAWCVERPWRKSRADRPLLFTAVCDHCGIVEDAHHIDGCWMGRHMESKSPAGLHAFVMERAECLRVAVR